MQFEMIPSGTVLSCVDCDAECEDVRASYFIGADRDAVCDCHLDIRLEA